MGITHHNSFTVGVEDVENACAIAHTVEHDDHGDDGDDDDGTTLHHPPHMITLAQSEKKNSGENRQGYLSAANAVGIRVAVLIGI